MSRSTTSQRASGVIALGAIGLALAGCGSGGSSGSDLASLDEPAPAAASSEPAVESAVEPSGPTTTIDPELAFAEFESCMSDFGIDIQIGEAGDRASVGQEDQIVESDDAATQAPTPDDYEAAEEECGPILDGALGEFAPTPAQEAEMADQLLEFTTCLKDKGFENVVVGPGDSVPADVEEYDPDELDAAFGECDELLEPVTPDGEV